MTQLDAASIVVNGQTQKCTLHILSHDELANSSLLEPLVQMQNHAFANACKQPILPATTTRYRSTEQYLGDKGEAATTFVLASEANPTEIYGAVSIGPYVDSEPPPADVPVHPARREFKWPTLGPAPASEARWLLSCLAVSPAVQKQGLAGRLIALAESYAVAQSKGMGTATMVRVLLSCVKENNGELYARRGFRTTKERRMPSGFWGSEAGFTIWFMDKFVDLDSESAGSLE